MNQPRRTWREVKVPAVVGASIVNEFAFKVIGAIVIVGSMVLMGMLFPDWPGYKFAVGAILGVVIAAVGWHGLDRMRGGPGVIDFQLRAHIFLAVGIGLALVLTVGLLAVEIRDQKRSLEYQTQATNQREENRAKLNSPDVQEGIRAMQEIQNRRDRRAASLPASGPARP